MVARCTGENDDCMALKLKTSLALAGVMFLVCTSPVIAALSDYLANLKGIMNSGTATAPANTAALSDADGVAVAEKRIRETPMAPPRNDCRRCSAVSLPEPGPVQTMGVGLARLHATY